MNASQKGEIIKKPNKVSVDSMVEYFIKMGKQVDSLLIKNDIDKKYIDYVKQMPSDYYSAINFGYGLDVHNNVFTNVQEAGKDGETIMSISALTSLYTEVLKKSSFEEYAQYVGMFIPDMKQAPDSKEYIESQYKVYGNVATKKNEVMLVINKDQQMSDLLLARLGYYTQEEFINLVYKADENQLYNPELDKEFFDYEELIGKDFYWYPNSKVFSKIQYGGKSSLIYNHQAKESWNDGTEVKLEVVGILQPYENISFGSLSSGIYYTQELTDHILSVNGSETDGIIDHYKNYDTSTLTDFNEIMAFGCVPYMLSYNHDDNGDGDYIDDGDKFTAVQTLILGGNAMLAGMGSGSSSQINIDPNEVRNSAIRMLGGNDLASSVTIYPVSFESKDLVTDYLNKWNGKQDLTLNGEVLTDADRQNIEYTDTLELVIDLINTMIDVVSYALIAFTSVSLVVSTVMIGIITYVSVVERIKEIGVIRSLGGRKKDVSRLFTAETFIIGLLSGLIGVGVTVGLTLIVSAIINALFGIPNIAFVEPLDAIILILLSIGLTLISGLLPARSAAKKDPVVALRTE